MDTSAQRTLRWIGLALTLGVVCGTFAVMAIAYAAVQGEVGLGITLRTILELFAVLSIVAFYARRWPGYGWAFWLSSATAGYLLNPLSWTGQALAGAAFLPAGLPTMALDLAIWLLATAVVVWVQGRRREAVPVPADVRELLR
ncbi:hypothetical protein [Branchiibius sp. NY16-3462-2]|uniref:hypothetical protein n=1 Tax=Branchiibius sp. NY16-3462-2 TaxID=1807500 RepID=UPI000793555C|nr:hypothetical protein [Branchiibius sp. NY16-3462-2]KYH45615.1 hypothetical protein AZH51_18010 [Branchiibius sp. NY16-3462-2]